MTKKLISKPGVWPNSVTVCVGGYTLDIQANEGLMVFVYNDATKQDGCVAMAYDSNIPHKDHHDLQLDGSETP